METIIKEITVAHRGERKVDLSPQGIRAGVIELSPWQIHPLPPGSHTAIDGDAYLIKINYELELDGDLHDGQWFEVGFAFQAAEGTVSVLDAVPGASSAPREERAYLVDQYLQLAQVPLATPNSVGLPASDDVTNVFGIGRSSVRWGHRPPRGGVLGPGSRAAWAVVLVPTGCTEVNVEFSARYRMSLEFALDFDPLDSSGEFTLELPNARSRGPVVPPPPPGNKKAMPSDDPGSHRVFICYAHDDDAHKLSALHFAHLLQDLDHDVHIDQLTDRCRRNWDDWATHQIASADFVVILASPMAHAVGAGTISDDRHKGLRNEFDIIRNLRHGGRSRWTMKVLPVVLPGESVENLPFWVFSEIVDHYIIDDFTPEALADLLKAMDAAKPFLQEP
ncbi:SEFIR domain-containing protein [Actinocorallia sp. A-T 12471]|uniref:SEFIR domain-containing protein n=1 Tax=Actinocorallia sp. A-T 12471 TaxID=3089813 RepID=UPI0029D26C26|nr:SEFIR domain-containing protein [Actinocorallia sp. A-T 12471]MDX6740418.1 SEFIR domain-containing protein [Actinocorallia sp. A-T 12471]